MLMWLVVRFVGLELAILDVGGGGGVGGGGNRGIQRSSRRADQWLECFKKQYTEVEYVVVETKWFTNYYKLQFCLVHVWLWAVYFSNAPSQLF